MEGDEVQHLPIVQGNPSIGETLKEIPWYTPSPEIKKTDGSVNYSKKVRIAKKEPKKPKAQTNAKHVDELVANFV